MVSLSHGTNPSRLNFWNWYGCSHFYVLISGFYNNVSSVRGDVSISCGVCGDCVNLKMLFRRSVSNVLIRVRCVCVRVHRKECVCVCENMRLCCVQKNKSANKIQLSYVESNNKK